MDEKEPITDDRARQLYVHAYAWDMGDNPSIGTERARKIQAHEWDAWLAAHDDRIIRDAAREALVRMIEHHVQESRKSAPGGNLWDLHSNVAGFTRLYRDAEFPAQED